MSSKLKRKSKPSYQKFLEKSNKISKQEKKEDSAILEISHHMNYAIYLALHDVLGFKFKRCKRFYQGICDLKNSWAECDARTEMMMNYCRVKNLPVYEWVKSIPMSKKFALASNSTCIGMDKYVDAAILVAAMMTAIILKETFRISKAKIFEVFAHIANSFDCFTKKQPRSKKPYLTDSMIIEAFKDEVKLDLVTGNKVA